MDLFVLAKYFRQNPDARKNADRAFFVSGFRGRLVFTYNITNS